VKTCPACSASYGNDVAFCPRDGAALRSSGGLEPGAIIRKKYEIIGEIGRGGMGVVYRARHLIWNEEKALKVLAAEGAGAQQGLKGLLAEAQVMRQLQHPHIVRVEDADYTEDDQPFVVMEYVEGQSLSQRLKSAGTLSPELALRIAAEACSALSAAHQKGIVHRDIKPQNLLLAKGADGVESVKVIDFGIAKVREDAGLGFTGIVTGTTGYFVCTPAYASPEQAQGMRGSDLDGRSDVYSLGLVLYEMLTGRLPFAADNPQALLVQRLQVEPMPLDRARPGLVFSPEVSGLVMKALAGDRGNRYSSAGEMERAIAALLDTWRAERERQERAPRPKERRLGSTTRVKGGPSRARLLTYGLGVLAALAILVFFIAREKGQKPVVNVEPQATRRPAPATRASPPKTEPPASRELPPVTRAAAPANVQKGVVKLEPQATQRPASAKSASPPKTEPLKSRELPPETRAASAAPMTNVQKPVVRLDAQPTERSASANSASQPKTGPPISSELPPETRVASVAGPAPPSLPEKPAAQQLRVRTDPKDGLPYVWIPPGAFTMGCSPGDNECFDNEKPPHAEQIVNGFWLGQTEVTQAAWKKVMNNNPSHFKGDELPVETVDWNQAGDYCKAIGGRLPTEEEWEYAARAGTTGARYGLPDAVGWYSGNSRGTTHPVGLKQANAFGLYDMLGNVMEWTADNYTRGASWSFGTRYVRASHRDWNEPSLRDYSIGLRCVAEFR
jgi:eukaryotic-like serine/threonine-protein kinase